MRSSDGVTGRVLARRARHEGGSAVVEFALLMPILLLLLLALVQVGVLARDRLLLAQASRAGAREAAITDSESAILEAVTRAGTGLDPARLRPRHRADGGAWKSRDRLGAVRRAGRGGAGGMAAPPSPSGSSERDRAARGRVSVVVPRRRRGRSCVAERSRIAVRAVSVTVLSAAVIAALVVLCDRCRGCRAGPARGGASADGRRRGGAGGGTGARDRRAGSRTDVARRGARPETGPRRNVRGATEPSRRS